MTSPVGDHAGAEAELVELLARHQVAYGGICSCGYTDDVRTQSLTQTTAGSKPDQPFTKASYIYPVSPEAHRAHVASIVAGWVRAREAAAWREGAEWAGAFHHEGVNPYEVSGDEQ
jgi:hypothetical protein